MGYRDNNGEYHDSWGTGEYSVNITLKENCSSTEDYRKNWKTDYKARQKAAKNGTFAERLWKVIKKQVWDAEGKKWIITTVKAPVDMVVGDIGEILGADKAKSASGAGAKSSGSAKPK